MDLTGDDPDVKHAAVAAPCIVVGGPSGCGKSTIGKLLAGRLVRSFVDADDYHTPENIAKMRAGLPLSDADRMPWLQRLARIIDEDLHAGRSLVLACSALKEVYRKTLRGRHSGQVLFVLLLPSHTELARRVTARTLAGMHFMPAVLLQSQLAILETEGPDVLTIEGDHTPVESVELILQHLAATKPG